MKEKIDSLVMNWRNMGPAAWAEGPYGFIMEDGQPIHLEPWQKAILEAWNAHREDISTLGISNIKKTGKTAMNAVFTAWRWLALPGQHFTAANDLDQSQARQFSMIADMVRRNPYLSQVVKSGKSELLFEPTGSRLTALATDATGNAGANFLTSSHTEAWGILYENGIRAWEELTPPPGRFYGLPSLRVADSYAGYLGESETWHKLVDRGLAGERVSEDWPIFKAGGLLLFHAEGEEARRRCFRGTQEEAREYYTEQRQSLRHNSFERMHSNTRTAAESAFLPDGAWDGCYSPEVKPLLPGDRRRIVLGADASTSRDLTALVGVAYNDTTQTADVVLVRVWKPERGIFRFGKPTIDLAKTIQAEIMAVKDQVSAVYYDPYQLHSIALELHRAGLNMIELPQTTGRIEADQALYDAVIGRTIRHYSDPTLNEHIQNAVAIETPRGYRLAKEKTSLKIDAAVALSMAYYGALQKMNREGPVTVMPDPFAVWPPPEGATWSQYGGWTTEWNRKTHPAGVTWRNCRNRNKGCDACIRELEAEGFYARDHEEANLIKQSQGELSPEEQSEKIHEIGRFIKQITNTGESNHDVHTIQQFWNTIKLAGKAKNH